MLKPETTQAVIDLSIVIPFLNEAASLPILWKRWQELEGLPAASEFIFVSDGSTDGSAEFIELLAEKEPRLKLVRLTRNFGHQAAISAGLSYASGAYVGIMDADLQDTPETLLFMWQEAVRDHLDIVYAIRASRRENIFKRAAYRLFYFLYGLLSETPVHMESGDFSVLSARAVEALRCMPEKVRFIRGLRSWIGMQSRGVPVARQARVAGKAQYTLRSLIRLAFRGITSFSTAPLRLATLVGFLTFGAAALLGTIYLLAAIFLDVPGQVPGFTTIVLLVLFMQGTNFLLLGILGEYLAQIFHEVKSRPSFMVDRTVNLPKD